ncbi:hypothetical protein RD792_015853 [Penstemon davidsonii]|uniref:Glabrous enhancer-binding protein-like DBD domain-containing protein n=1 Tax=Penstemon davidsonii TaxID=160366 RepID=A0ABR0CKF0_9LAMI|nr:hypothetical protein RD792_015853 [Penstemon davidsonii]
MASAAEDPPSNPTAPTNIFNEDEDLLDDDEDDESEDDSAADFLTPSSGAAAQVTIAVPGVADLHLKQQQPENIVVAKKPAQPDESRKLFQRLWNDEDEIELLQGFLDYTSQRGGPHNSSHHHHDTTAFYDQIKSKFQLDFNKNQLVEKLRRLKKKYRNVINKLGSGKDYAFKSPHEQATFDISSRIWGNTINNGSSSAAFRPVPTPVIPVDEDDDDPNNPDFQSYNPNGIDVNSKTPRPRKRNRSSGPVKVEQHQQQNSPSVAVTPPMATGTGITGSMSGVIEETVKSCLSPIFKELLGNSMSPNLNPNGSCCGNGFGLALSPIPLGFAAALGGDKMMADDKWRKQQILELEVFSKRLELVQDQINEQLQELRSMGN